MSPPAPLISIVSPVYNSAAIIAELVNRIDSAVSEITNSFEIILVDDGSSDESWQEILDVSNSSKLVACKLQNNVGQHYAIRAGLELAKGMWVIVMDCDLQDNPNNIPLLYQRAIEGSDTVLAHRLTKRNSLYYVLSSLILNAILSLVTGRHFNYRTGNFGIFHQKVVQQVLDLPIRYFYFPIAIRRVSISVPTVKVMHDARFAGSSTYNFKRQLSLALQAIQYCFSPERHRVDSAQTFYSVETLISAKFDK